MKHTQHILSLIFVFIGVFLSQSLLGQLIISRDNIIADQGGTVCMEFVVEDFDDLVSTSFAVNWDPAVVRYARIENINPLFSAGDFNDNDTDQGELFFTWIDLATAPRSLSDGEIIFTVCFEAIGAEGEESKIRIGNGSNGSVAEALDKDLNSIPVSAPDALINIEFSEAPDNAIEVYYDDVDIVLGESFCVPMRARNFNDVLLLSYTLVFDNNRFMFDSMDKIESFNNQASILTLTSNANTRGEIIYSMTDNTADGQTIDDGDILFELCFTHKLVETCVFDEIMMSSSPTTIEGEVALPDLETEEAPVFYDPGKIRLRTPINYIGQNTTPVNCSQPDIGAISVDADGGTDGIKYLWSTGETTSSIANLTAGTYSVSISDVCLAVDTIFRTYEVLQDGNNPTADAGDDLMIDCPSPTVLLDGSGSSSGSTMMYTWRGLGGQSILGDAMIDQVMVTEEGQYELLVVDESSGCTAKDTVDVTDVRVLPDVMAGDDVVLDCDDVTIDLIGTGDNGINHDYNWTTEDGVIVEKISKDGVRIGGPGTYVFSITDKLTQCTGTDEVIVSGSNVEPDVNIVGSPDITCTESEVSLDANNTEQSGVSYTWQTSDGVILSGANEFNAVINAAGTYTVTAVNDVSGCSSDDSFVVIDSRTTPSIVTSGDTEIDCDDDDITLVGSGSSGPEFQYTWTTEDGSIISQTPAGEAIVNSSGTYTFTIVEIANGCPVSENVLVTGDNQRPLAGISGGTTLDCSTTSISLNANNGGGAVAGLSYVWSTMDGSIVGGADGVLATIDQPGTYTVRVTNDASGCSNNATEVVTSESDEPVITSSADETIDCSTEVKTLTANTDNASNMRFSWSVVAGNGQVISGDTSTEVEVMGAGEYEIVVTNPLTGCSSRDTITVNLNGSLPEALLGMDYDHCDTETILMGNQSADITGQWTVVRGSARLEDPMDRNCRVNSLGIGINTFAWTLSSSGCPDYSSDTININFIPEPVALNDVFNVEQGFGSLDIDLLSNDQFYSETGATINLASQPSLGVLIENGNGQFTYNLENPNAFGNFTFEYEICDDLCSLNCDIGSVTINVIDASLPPMDAIETTNEPQSLGITPNGDGLNDQLIFDELITNSDDYKTKRLIVYNRWGDIVHEAQPYNNDWGGTSNSGTLLPQGTYYFVMQLDLGQGVIIEGDITILQ